MDTYREGQVLASEDPDARDAAFIVRTKQEHTGKGILSEFVQALVHACEKHGGFDIINDYMETLQNSVVLTTLWYVQEVI